MELDRIAVVENFPHLKKMNVTNCIRSKAEFLAQPYATDCAAFASRHLLVRLS